MPQNAVPGAKLFAGCYALFSGVLFLTSAGVILAPLVHRMMHKFHLSNAYLTLVSVAWAVDAALSLPVLGWPW